MYIVHRVGLIVAVMHKAIAETGETKQITRTFTSSNKRNHNMKRKNNPPGFVTLLLIIVAIVILHALRDLQNNDGSKTPVDAALTEKVTKN
jgi:hypothetical protein